MRLVFVNHTHPQIPHVSAARFSNFARVMTKRGHEVILLCGPASSEVAESTTEWGAMKEFPPHKWKEPFIAAISAVEQSHSRPQELPQALRRLRTLWNSSFGCGVQRNWVSQIKRVAPRIASDFRPDLIWGTFGTTSNLLASRYLASVCCCPWVVDIKDHWSLYLDHLSRHTVAYRIRDATAFTANSLVYQREAGRYLRQEKSTIVYSGVSPEFFERSFPDTSADETRDVVLIGSIYNRKLLETFLLTFKRWLTSSCMGHAVRFVYAGSDYHAVSKVLANLNLSCRQDVWAQLPISELAKLCQHASVNCYLWADFGFHHKLLELLCCGKPVITFPGESEESKRLATQCGTPVFFCDSELSLLKAFSCAFNMVALPLQCPENWSWEGMAAGLEAFFFDVLQPS